MEGKLRIGVVQAAVQENHLIQKPLKPIGTFIVPRIVTSKSTKANSLLERADKKVLSVLSVCAED